MVTKMVTNTRSRAAIERDKTARAADFSNINQCLSGQNETGWGGRQQILSQARLPIPPQGLGGDHSGEAQGVNGPYHCRLRSVIWVVDQWGQRHWCRACPCGWNQRERRTRSAPSPACGGGVGRG